LKSKKEIKKFPLKEQIKEFKNVLFKIWRFWQPKSRGYSKPMGRWSSSWWKSRFVHESIGFPYEQWFWKYGIFSHLLSSPSLTK